MARPVIAADLGGPVETVRARCHRLARAAGRCGHPGRGDRGGAGVAAGGAGGVGDGARAWPCCSGYTVAAMQAATLAVYQEVLRGPITLPAAAQEADTDEAKAQQ